MCLSSKFFCQVPIISAHHRDTHHTAHLASHPPPPGALLRTRIRVGSVAGDWVTIRVPPVVAEAMLDMMLDN